MKLKSRILYTLSILGLLILPLAQATPTKAATFPGENGKITYTKGNSIWTVENKQVDPERLVQGGHSPNWSPDGSKLVFVNKKGQLQTVNADGSERKNLTKGVQGVESSPIWSPDGKRIAFVREETGTTGNKRSAIFNIKPNGKKETNISGWANNKGYRSPSWAPDSNLMVYEHYSNGQNKLIIRNINISHQRTLTVTSDSNVWAKPSWSPNGKKILYRDSANEIYTIWPDGSHRTVISDGDSYEASWSPDGKRIAFLEDFSGENVSISEENGDITHVDIGYKDYQDMTAPTWSPDGEKLAFTLKRPSETKASVFSLTLNYPKYVLIKLTEANASEFDWQSQ